MYVSRSFSAISFETSEAEADTQLSSALHAARNVVLLLITAFYVLAPVRTAPAVLTQEQLKSTLEGTAHTNRLQYAVRGAVVRDPHLLKTATQGEVAFARAEDKAFADSADELRQSGYSRAANKAGARAWLDSVWVKSPSSPAPRSRGASPASAGPANGAKQE
jgi:hypothetical protein